MFFDLFSKILEESGNIVDAALATMFCSGINVAQSMGIGGGFVMNLYIHKEKKAYTINAKETSPLAATADMFKTPESYKDGPLSIGVPGEIKGYWELHKKYGNLPWKDLIAPTIKICEDGITMSKHMSDAIGDRLMNDTYLRKTFFKNETNERRKAFEHIQLPTALCNTYKLLAENGGDDFYNGTLADLILEDLNDLGSIISKKDLQSYS